MSLKLRQGQLWKHGTEFIRIVHLERLKVGYKTLKSEKASEGKHHQTTKKEFCRLLKACTLLGASDTDADGDPAPVSGPSD